MPGRLKWAVFSTTSPAYSLLVPQLLEISVAPRRAAASSAASRSDPYEELASTSTTLQVWQISWAVSTSRAISRAQPAFLLGNGPDALPDWLTLVKKLPVAALWAPVGQSASR